MIGTETISNPVLWALLGMIAFTAVQALGALWARNDFAVLGALAHEIGNSDTFTRQEKREIASMLGYAVHWSTPVGIFMIAPFVSAFVMARLVAALFKGMRVTPENLEKVMPESSVVHKRVGNAVFKANPFLGIWAAIWLLPAVLLSIITVGSLRLVVELIRRAYALAFERQATHHQ